MEKKVSVIIPCYNSEKNLAETLESIFNQSYYNFELILIDDGSQDNTWELIQAIKDRRIIKYHQENKGVSAARNKGIELSTGEYILFVDSDDVINKNYIKFLVNALESGNQDVAFCFFSRNKKVVEEDKNTKIKEIFLEKNQEEMMKILLYEKHHLGFSTYIYIKEIIQKYEIRFPINIKTGEDIEFLWKYLVHCKKGIQVNKYLYWYKDNKESSIYKIYWKRTDSYQSLKDIYKKMKEFNCPFSEEFISYMEPRYLWSYAKTFASGKRKDLFNQLKNTYDVKKAMIYLIKKSPDMKVKLLSFCFIIHPSLFYCLIALYFRFLKRLYRC